MMLFPADAADGGLGAGRDQKGGGRLEQGRGRAQQEGQQTPADHHDRGFLACGCARARIWGMGVMEQ